jgi:hypothetical protein
MAVGRASTYKQVLKKTERETHQRLNKALQNTAIEGINRLVDRTPVDTGAAKFHWFMRLVPDEKFDPTRVDPSGEQPKKGAKRTAKLFRIGQIVYLVNSAPYFKYLEHGSSKQAPQGVVAITLAEMNLIWQKEIKVAFSKDVRAS